MNECEWLSKEYIKRRFPSCVETPKEELFTEALWTLVDFFLQTEPMKQVSYVIKTA